MKKSFVLIFSLFICCTMYSQTIFFKYDEAGNQRYRGPDENAKPSKDVSRIVTNTSTIFNEKDFWNEVRIYPVPVKDVLTIDWTEKVDSMIAEVSMYQHSNLSWIFQHKNISTLNRNIKVDMTRNYFGVYVITFILKDGSRVTKNIIKN